MTDINIGVYGSDTYQGGIYNVLASFVAGFHDALKKVNPNTAYMYEYFVKNSLPNLSIAFNVYEHESWDVPINAGVPHMMWAVDSPFMHTPMIEKYYQNPKFIFACVSPVDEEPVKYFYPGLEFLYFPHACDPAIWHPDDGEKEHDIVFLSSVKDYEADIEALKKQIPPAMFKMFMDMYQCAMRNPEMSFWDIYKVYSDIYEFSLKEYSLFFVFFNKLCYSVTYKRRIEMLRALKDFNVKVWGLPTWKQYIEGNVQYMGMADVFESAKIIRKSKIVLHIQPMHILYGLHERVLNSLASETFVLSDYNQQFEFNFPGCIDYFNSYTFDGLADKVEHYLNNDEVRTEKAKKGRELVLKNHTWDNRAQTLMNTLLGT
jgi:spore maturation protein CgeB